MRTRAHLSLLFIAMPLSGGLAHAGPEARVRVRGTARLEASAAATNTGFTLRGTVLEDAGKPVASGTVQIRLQGRDGSPRLLPRSEPCSPLGPQRRSEPYRGSEEATASTDASGRFCVRWPLELPDGKLLVTFEDTRQLLDRAELGVDIERPPALEVGFAPPPRALSLDQPTLDVLVESRVRAAGTAEIVPLVLAWARGDAAPVTLLERRVRVGEPVRLEFAASLLGGAGPGELRVTLGSGENTASARAPLVATADVQLRTAPTLDTNAAGEGTLEVEVTASVGAVRSGAVEALAADRTVGIAPVVDGRAELSLALGAGPATVPLAVRYLPASPWWIAGLPREVRALIPRPSRWSGFVWAMALAAIALWITGAWRRPIRLDRPAPLPGPTPPSLEPELRWVAPDEEADGWIGTVADAHDGRPLARVQITVELADGDTLGAVTGDDGTFHVRSSAEQPTPGKLSAEAPWHGRLQTELPPRGRLAITLVTRRRLLLARLVEWTRQRGMPWASSAEPTPSDLAALATRLERRDVGAWARAVEGAAFGPEAVDAAAQAGVEQLEPKRSPEERPVHGQ